MSINKLKIIECPRDAMQGIKEFISTEKKASYINKLLEVGFDTLDFGSFVSSEAVPQMRDTADVLDRLKLTDSTHLLAIIANLRGAETAAAYNEIKYLGFPLSVSETFQQKNTNKSISQAFELVESIQNICIKQQKDLVVYLSMGFGNPYGDPYNVDVIADFVERLDNLEINTISLSDTIGVSTVGNIHYLFSNLIASFPHMEFGAHLHAHPATVYEKLDAAYRAGCRRFDGAIKGYGGCPMAADDLVGNIATESIVSYLEKNKIEFKLNKEKLEEAIQMSSSVFPS
jgi:hydroxymethylglutaryl-CoA lyase